MMYKQLPDYQLLSESFDHLRHLQAPVEIRIFTERWRSVDVDRYSNNEIVSKDTPQVLCIDGPVFMHVTSLNRTWIIHSDRLRKSLVAKSLSGSPADDDFLDNLYSIDSRVPEYLKAKSLVDTSVTHTITEFNLCSLRIYKKAVNSLMPKKAIVGRPTVKYEHELLMLLHFENNVELALTYMIEFGDMCKEKQLFFSVINPRFCDANEISNCFRIDFTSSASQGDAKHLRTGSVKE